MGFLHEVRLPRSGSALSIHGRPQLLVWSSERTESSEEALGLVRSWIAGRLGLSPRQVSDVPTHTGKTPELIRAATLELLGSRVSFAWVSSQRFPDRDDSWWSEVLLPELKAKWPGIREAEG